MGKFLDKRLPCGKLHRLESLKIDVVVDSERELRISHRRMVKPDTNRDYASKWKPPLSLKLASAQLGNTYVIRRIYSYLGRTHLCRVRTIPWYMVAESKNAHSRVAETRESGILTAQDGGCIYKHRDADEVTRIGWNLAIKMIATGKIHTQNRDLARWCLPRKYRENFAPGNQYYQLYWLWFSELVPDAIDTS